MLKHNGVEIKKHYHNGVEVKKHYHNGVLVWKKNLWRESSTLPIEYVTHVPKSTEFYTRTYDTPNIYFFKALNISTEDGIFAPFYKYGIGLKIKKNDSFFAPYDKVKLEFEVNKSTFTNVQTKEGAGVNHSHIIMAGLVSIVVEDKIWVKSLGNGRARITFIFDIPTEDIAIRITSFEENYNTWKHNMLCGIYDVKYALREK